MNTIKQTTDISFENYINTIVHRHLQNAAIIGIVLIPSFFMLDYYIITEQHLGKFAIYRIITVIIIAIQYFMIRQSKPNNKTAYHGYLFSFLVAGMITLMTVYQGGFDSNYYAGLILAIITINILIAWKPIHSAFSSLIILSLYLAVNFSFEHNFQTYNLISNLFFLISTIIIAVTISYSKHNIAKTEFYLREDLKEARDSLWGEMEIAQQIQTSLLPSTTRIDNYEVSAKMITAEEVGGDFYDIIYNKDGENWVAIGDVSGHGVESGLIMMMTQTSIITMIKNNKSLLPSQVLSSINSVLRLNINRLKSDKYMTLSVIKIEKNNITVAGKHQDIIIYRHSSGEVELYPIEGTWLAIADDIAIYNNDVRIKIAKNDIILLYTDGITEAMNAEGDMFGETRLLELLKEYHYHSTENIIRKIIDEVFQFQEKLRDDLSLVAIKRV